ncbi:hypothetical protein [Rhizobium sp. AN69]|uniref:hypothetical protein n=2 Tax=unclassified Rhizobium TaxID=2613769 RepID=UPI002B25D1D0|nr:hypothetical protein [Rhizobium sp. AN69]
MQRSLVAMLQFTDDTLLHGQPAADHVEFDPMLEGEAVDEAPDGQYDDPIGDALGSRLSPSSSAFPRAL